MSGRQSQAVAITSRFIVGPLHHGPRGSWFELADECAGREANTFDTEAEAQAALDELGWSAEIHALADVERHL